MCCSQANVTTGRALCLPQREANRIYVEEGGKSGPRTHIYINMYTHLLCWQLCAQAGGVAPENAGQLNIEERAPVPVGKIANLASYV